ncbi:RloB family protein [Flavobacterium filum]|uniref:RloB family protein n=1 Tax=Flavobacterium filum TaxID=370974 RepID=UPI0023F02031|nr:RloB family protein [Flavobacterium filum]
MKKKSKTSKIGKRNIYQRRFEDTREQKQSILIYCEGVNTEPSYFKQFELSTATIKVDSNGESTIGLVEAAISFKATGKYDQIWCVFDMDGNGKKNFNRAIELANQNGLGVAYSNQGFEYWLLLHLIDHQGQKMHRKDYQKRINKELKESNITYNWDDRKLIEKEFFDVLYKQTELAIVRAERIYNRLDHKNLAKGESSTTVFMLVREILRYI